MSYGQTSQRQPDSLRELAENLSNTFLENFKRNKPNSTLNPSRYLSRICFDSSDSFRDRLSNFDPTRFSFSNFGDELTPKDENNNSNIGIKRTGIDLNGPANKKRKLSDGIINNIINEEDEDEDSEEEEEKTDKNTNKKHRKLKLPEKFKNDEDFQSLQAPTINPSKADEFFDPINYCKINLEEENRINISTKEYLNKYELLNKNDIDMSNKNKNKIKYINTNKLNEYLINKANKNGYTIQKDISLLLCLSLKDHLKNMFDDMNHWRNSRINKINNNMNYNMKYNKFDKQQWIDNINSKYSVKQQITEAKDEIEALETEKTDLDFKKMTGILTDEETKRRSKLDSLIRAAKQKQKQNDQLRANAFSLAALGGDFTFNFHGNNENNNNKNKNKNKNNKYERKLQEDKFYVIDVINMIENNQKYNQQHLKQLSKLYLKQM